MDKDKAAQPPVIWRPQMDFDAGSKSVLTEYDRTGVLYYQDFIISRVKWMPTWQENMLHAAIGMIGEAVELGRAATAENFLEELGDFGFYHEHFWLATQQLSLPPLLIPGSQKLNFTFNEASNFLVDGSGTILDCVKKMWVYQEPFEKRAAAVGVAWWQLSQALDVIAEVMRVSWLDVRLDNVRKLEKRFPTGYSNAAAQARADKPEGE